MRESPGLSAGHSGPLTLGFRVYMRSGWPSPCRLTIGIVPLQHPRGGGEDGRLNRMASQKAEHHGPSERNRGATTQYAGFSAAVNSRGTIVVSRPFEFRCVVVDVT